MLLVCKHNLDILGSSFKNCLRGWNGSNLVLDLHLKPTAKTYSKA